MTKTGSPTFSVIIPAFNASGTLCRAIDSVIAQTRPAHEIIIVDDGSTDDTALVCAKYRTQIVYLHQTNAGPSAARNRGVQIATGEWIAFLDADDWYYPDRLKVHIELILEMGELDFIVSSYDFIDEAGNRMSSSLANTKLGMDLLSTVGQAGRTVLDEIDIGRFMEAQFSDTRGLSIPRNHFNHIGGFPEDFKICEDVLFMLRMCAVSTRAGVTVAPQAAYVVHDSGLIRSNQLRAQLETVRALSSIKTDLISAPFPVRRAWRNLTKEAHLDLAHFLLRTAGKRAALSSIFSSFRLEPSLRDAKDFLSILRG